MPAARPRQRPIRVALLIWALFSAALVWPTAASAARAVVTARLSLTGILSSSTPLGAQAMAIHPGDTVDFRVGTIPELDRLGLSKRLDYEVRLDSAGLPGGGRSVSLNSDSTYRVTFPKSGIYSFHWQATSIHARGDGHGREDLHGDLLRLVRAALHSSERFSGHVVVGTPTEQSISVEVPKVSVQVPNVLEDVPKVTVDVPKVSVDLPEVLVNVKIPGFGHLPEITLDGVVINPASAPGIRPGTVEVGRGSGRPSVVGSLVGPSGPPGGNPSTASRAIAPLADPPARSATATPPRAAQPVPPSATTPRNPPRAAAGPLTPVATYVFSGLLGFLILGALWMLWVASIRPILGR